MSSSRRYRIVKIVLSVMVISALLFTIYGQERSRRHDRGLGVVRDW